jgi:acetoin utilization deacetylase AcuC-like enzyme
MPSTGLYYSPQFLRHEAPGHPEAPARLTAIWGLLQRHGLLLDLAVSQPAPADLAVIEGVHSAPYIRAVRAMAAAGGGWMDGDTFVSPASFDAAVLAAGAAVDATAAVLVGRQRNAFVLVRPPGHHAVRDQAMGFCLFNNVAVAAQWAIQAGGAQRVLIVDFDVHHGNGTQEIFYERADVCFFSIHQFPLYPGTGRLAETGSGAGAGTTANIPLPPGCGNTEYWRAFDEILTPLAQRWQPDVILVSAGYDAHWRDPLANMRLTVEGYVGLMERLCALAADLCDGRLVVVLEGGYNLDAIAAAAVASAQILAEHPPLADPYGPPPPHPLAPLADQVLAAARAQWGL